MPNTRPRASGTGTTASDFLRSWTVNNHNHTINTSDVTSRTSIPSAGSISAERMADIIARMGEMPAGMFDGVIQPTEQRSQVDIDDEDVVEDFDAPDDFFDDVPRPARFTVNRDASSEHFIRPQRNDFQENDMIAQFFNHRQDVSTVNGHPLINGVCRIGVELEVENIPSPPRRLRYWETKSDGSLRNNGIEFVFRGPMGGQDAFNAITELDGTLYNSEVDLNIRCSTHVHVDARDMTVPELKRFILAYCYYELFLFRQSGEYRVNSNFCTPMSKAEGMIDILSRFWFESDSSFLDYISSNWDKYCSINLLPLRQFGSIEIRMSEAKSRRGQMLRLCNRFLAIQMLAKNSNLEGVEFLEHIRSLPVERVFRRGLTKTFLTDNQDFETGWLIANDILCKAALLGSQRSDF